MQTDPTVLAGEIIFDEGATPPSGATVHVRIEDVSRADTAAVEAARIDIRDVTRSPGQALSFEMSANLNPEAHYQVRVHVDMDDTGRVTAGDQVSVESVPVLTRGHPNRVRVTVRQV